MWRSKPSLLRTWSQRWNRVSWFQRLSSRILKPSQRISFETALTSLLEDTRASRFQRQESDLAPKTQDTSGPTSDDHIQSIRPVRCMFENVEGHISLGLREVIGDLEGAGYRTAWGIFSALKSAHLIRESGFTYSVPTPTVGMEAPNKNANTKGPKNLMDVATGDWQHLVPRYWPTPASRDYRSVTGREHLQRDNCMQNLNVAAVYRQTWPTPAARDYKGRSGAGRQERRGNPSDTLPNAVGNYLIPTVGDKNKVGHLNPDWVEWLMGVPTGWTELGSWETE
jgi:hypothetical protein